MTVNDKIEYQATIEDITAVTYRVTESVGAVKRAQRNALLVFPFVLAFFLLIPDQSLGRRTAYGLVVAAFCTALQLFTYKGAMRKSIRKMMVEQYGGEGPFPAGYELSDGGLIYRIAAIEMRFSWAGMDGVSRDGDHLVVDIGRPKNASSPGESTTMEAARKEASAARRRLAIRVIYSP